MVLNKEEIMSTNYPTVIPMLAYEDGAAALDWLAKAFGFRERTRMKGIGFFIIGAAREGT
jgi:hypothetical protein